MRDADDHAATVRAFLDNCVPGLTTPDVADAQAALDALVAALAQAEHERDEARKHANKLGRELDEQGDELERAERQRDQADLVVAESVATSVTRRSAPASCASQPVSPWPLSTRSAPMSLREHLSFALAFFCVIDDDREREAA